LQKDSKHSIEKPYSSVWKATSVFEQEISIQHTCSNNNGTKWTKNGWYFKNQIMGANPQREKSLQNNGSFGTRRMMRWVILLPISVTVFAASSFLSLSSCTPSKCVHFLYMWRCRNFVHDSNHAVRVLDKVQFSVCSRFGSVWFGSVQFGRVRFGSVRFIQFDLDHRCYSCSFPSGVRVISMLFH